MRKIVLKFSSKFCEGKHKNIFLEIPPLDVVEIMDSYYLALDNSFMIKNESETKVLLILIKNLIYWGDCSVSMLEKEEKYLPIDWSDQYVGFIILRKNKTDLAVSYGVTLNVINETRPSIPEAFNPVQPIYHIEDWILNISVEDFIKNIKLNIKELSLLLDAVDLD